jgi:hypothetical protein
VEGAGLLARPGPLGRRGIGAGPRLQLGDPDELADCAGRREGVDTLG